MTIIQNIIIGHLSKYESAYINELAEIVDANTYRNHGTQEIVNELMMLVEQGQVCVEGQLAWIERAAA